MSHARVAVSWTPFKKRFDGMLIALVVTYLVAFVGVGFTLFPKITPEILLIRAFGTAAILLLNLILVIGPLARLDRRWLPLLANRRHAGVSCFLLALIHAVLVIGTYHAGSEFDPLLSIFVSDAGMRAAAFPFQAFGFFALLVLFAMAATSHDFWLAALGAPAWKALHMLVYAAWLLLIVHVSMGVLQSETHPLLLGAMGTSIVVVGGLHLASAWKQSAFDEDPHAGATDWVDVAAVDDLPTDRPLGVSLSGDRVALVKTDRGVSAVSGICQHQNGPLAEGRMIDGCLTCPWHGFQYRVEDGCAPAPFTEKLPTFRVKIEDGRVYVHPTPLPAGTFVEPAKVD